MTIALAAIAIVIIFILFCLRSMCQMLELHTKRLEIIKTTIVMILKEKE